MTSVEIAERLLNLKEEEKEAEKRVEWGGGKTGSLEEPGAGDSLGKVSR